MPVTEKASCHWEIQDIPEACSHRRSAIMKGHFISYAPMYLTVAISLLQLKILLDRGLSRITLRERMELTPACSLMRMEPAIISEHTQIQRDVSMMVTGISGFRSWILRT